MSKHQRSLPFLGILGFALGLLLLAPLALAESVTFLFETRAQGELEPCG